MEGAGGSRPDRRCKLARFRVEPRTRGDDGVAHPRRRGCARMTAIRHGAFERQRGEHVVADFAGERLQLRERQIGEIAAALVGQAHRARDGLVRIAERHALAHQVIGEIGGRRVALGGRRAHPRRVDRDAGGDEIRHDRERVGERVDDVEQRLLVLLIVAVVGERLRLHQHQQRDHVAGDAPGLAARELDDIGILLLRHDRRSGAEAIGERHEREARIHPPRELFGEARDVRHRQRRGGGELDGEIPIGHRVEGILAERLRIRARARPAPDRSGTSCPRAPRCRAEGG